MGTHYSQLSLRERCEIGLLKRDGLSIRHIAVKLGRPASTVSRELARNAKPTKQWRGDYDPERAHGLALRRRRWDPRHKLARQPDLQAYVRDHLAMGRSPEQIAGRLALEQRGTLISHESIYRFIYHRSAQKDYWHRLLPRAKHRRGRRGRRGGSPANFIPGRVCVSAREPAANARTEPGHWEGDLMLFRIYGQAVLAAHERTSRFTRIVRQPSKAAHPVAESLKALFTSLPPALRRSITFDNGTEFTHHQDLRLLGMATYFCRPHAPWQKGGIENAIGRLRRRLPRRTDLKDITQAKLDEIAAAYNNTPRKCLGFLTPAEVFSSLINRVALQP